MSQKRENVKILGTICNVKRKEQREKLMEEGKDNGQRTSIIRIGVARSRVREGCQATV